MAGLIVRIELCRSKDKAQDIKLIVDKLNAEKRTDLL